MSKQTINIALAVGFFILMFVGLWFSVYKDVSVLTGIAIIFGAFAGNRLRAARELKK